MQLVMRRKRLTGGIWHNFVILVHLTPNNEESLLIAKYMLRNVTLTAGNTLRDLKRSLFATVPFSLLVTALLMYTKVGLNLIVFVITLLLSTFVLYHQIREAVRVDDLLQGREFKARSLIDLLLKEQQIRKMSTAFEIVLDQARTWDKPEVVELKPEPLLSVLEGDRALA
jgi:hypothetical protein